jgi:3-hydroxy-3-methylglutaryl CoA synthase
MFSYGSGLAATMFSLKTHKGSTEKLQEISEKVNLDKKLNDRVAISAEKYSEVLSHPLDFILTAYNSDNVAKGVKLSQSKD